MRWRIVRLDNDRPLPPLSSPFFTPFSPQPSSRTVNCGGNNSAEEDGYDYPARFRSPPSDFHNPSPGRGEEKAGESGGEVGGRDEYEMRSESSRRGSGAGGEMRGEGWEGIEDLLSPSLFPSSSLPFFLWPNRDSIFAWACDEIPKQGEGICLFGWD